MVEAGQRVEYLPYGVEWAPRRRGRVTMVYRTIGGVDQVIVTGWDRPLLAAWVRAV